MALDFLPHEEFLVEHEQLSLRHHVDGLHALLDVVVLVSHDRYQDVHADDHDDVRGEQVHAQHWQRVANVVVTGIFAEHHLVRRECHFRKAHFPVCSHHELTDRYGSQDEVQHTQERH